MRKHKFYLGKRHLNHDLLRLGVSDLAPRMLRKHYKLVWKLRQQELRFKMHMNSCHGAVGSYSAAASANYGPMLEARVQAAKGAKGRLPYTEAKAIYERNRALLGGF